MSALLRAMQFGFSSRVSFRFCVRWANISPPTSWIADFCTRWSKTTEQNFSTPRTIFFIEHGSFFPHQNRTHHRGRRGLGVHARPKIFQLRLGGGYGSKETAARQEVGRIGFARSSSRARATEETGRTGDRDPQAFGRKVGGRSRTHETRGRGHPRRSGGLGDQ